MLGVPVARIELADPVQMDVKVACNVAHRKEATDNRLGELLRSWFGADAGSPGTGFRVRFRNSTDGWSVQPVQTL